MHVLSLRVRWSCVAFHPWFVAAVVLAVSSASAQQRVLPEDLDKTVARVVAAKDSPEEGVELGLACLAALSESPDPELEGQVRLALGVALVALERFTEAFDHLQAGARLAGEAGNNKSLAHCRWLQAAAAFQLGQLDDAVDAATDGLEAATSAGWDAATWRLANTLGLAEERRGDSHAALRAYGIGQEVAERLARESGDREGVRVLLGNIGIAYMNLGELDQALEIFQRVLQMTLESPSRYGLDSALANVGDALILLDRTNEAEGYHLRALALRRETGSEVELALSYCSIGAIYLELDKPEAALAEFDKALEIRQRLELAPDVAATLTLMAQAYAALDRDDEALNTARRGLALTDQLQMKGRRAAVLQSLAAVHEQLGDHGSAIKVIREAAQLEREQRSIETRRQLAAFRAEFDARENEQQIALLTRTSDLQELALSKRRYERNALLVGAMFLSLAAIAGWLAWASLRRATKRIEGLERDRLRSDKLESIGVLAGGIAHDFNNILAAAMGNLSLLRLETQRGDEDRALLDDAEQALRQGAGLSKQLLSFSKGGFLERKIRAFEPLLRQATHLALSGSASKAELETARDLWCADIDAEQIRQVFTNLILNADQAMPNGGTIRVRAENVHPHPDPQGKQSHGPSVRVTIADQGVGIDPSIKDRVFDPYFTTKKEGTGLGLALAYAIIRRHAGAIDHGLSPGGGTEFEVLIPAVPGAQEPPEPTEEGIRLGRGRVLVMDDDPLIQRVYSSALTRLGYECELAENGHEAIERFEQAQRDSRPFRAVILDLTIPGGMGGGEAVSELLRRDPDVRAIVASGYSNDRLLENFQEAGFVAALPKPFQLATLSRALEEALQSRAPVEAT